MPYNDQKYLFNDYFFSRSNNQIFISEIKLKLYKGRSFWDEYVNSIEFLNSVWIISWFLYYNTLRKYDRGTTSK